MELAVAAAEAGVGEDAAPRLADRGGADKVLWLVRRKAEEYLLEELVQQHRRRRQGQHGTAVETRVLGGLGIKERARAQNRVAGCGFLCRLLQGDLVDESAHHCRWQHGAMAATRVLGGERTVCEEQLFIPVPFIYHATLGTELT